MKTPDMVASALVDGPHPFDRTMPLIDRDADDGRDFLTVSRRVYRVVVAAAVSEAVAERDAEVERLTAERDHHEQQQRVLLYDNLPKLRAERDDFFQQCCDLLHERDQLAAEVERLKGQVATLDRERREAHAFLTGKFETGWCMSHPDGQPETELGKAAAALLAKSRDLEAEVAALRERAGKPAEDWPNLTHQMRDRLFRLCQEVGVVRENQWLSEVACEAIENLRERIDGQDGLRAQIVGHCERIAKQSDLLSKRAERPADPPPVGANGPDRPPVSGDSREVQS